MTQTLTEVALFLTAVGSGIIGGVFFAFSTFVLGALQRLPAAHGIAAMQSINRVVLNPAFLGVFLVTALTSVFLVITWFLQMASGYALTAALLYLLGTFGTTILGNVPLNERLEKFQSETSEAAEFWKVYCRRWTLLNHLRTLAAIAATATLFIGRTS